MKKVLGIMAVVALSALMFTSCGKKCTCTYYENGKKISSWVQGGSTYKYYDKTSCMKNSEPKETWEGMTYETVCK